MGARKARSSSHEKPAMELVSSHYTPTETEIDEPFVAPPGTTPTDVVRALGQKVKLRFIKRPRR